MLKSMNILSCLALMALTTFAQARSPPAWPSGYAIQGMLVIPFAEVEEPFMAFYDKKRSRSRIDYYGGLDKTFQRGDVGEFGTAFKVIPMTDEDVVNKISCFQTNGTDEDSRIKAQGMLPDLTGFELQGNTVYNGQDCEKWQLRTKIGEKVNKYTMLLKWDPSPLDPKMSTPVPLHYEMKGANTLLGSHYDHYYITYSLFVPETPKDLVFDFYKKSGPCTGWPGPGNQHVYHMNPMKEFVDNHGDHVDAAFEEFKSIHGKEYRDLVDHEKRKDIFRQNQRFIHSNNRRGLSYSLASNHLADLTGAEMNRMRGRLYTPGYNGGKAFTYTAEDVKDAPEQLDWRLFGAVSPVKDQSVCGSCWSFGTVGTLEGALFLKTGQMTRLSQQSLVDCSWGFGNNGCDGGEDFRVYQFMLKHGGIPTEEDYGPYLGQDGLCHWNSTKPFFQIKDYVNVTSGDLDALKVAIAKHGPVSVGIDASHKSLAFYSSGVYYEPECKNKPDDLDHAVLAVGYGEIAGQKYWLVKNSWSTYWGNDGYVLMSQKDNNCGVASAPTFVNPA